MTTTPKAPAARTGPDDGVVRLGRIALSTQGVLYVVLGLLAAKVASGDQSATPSQEGAIASVARQPYGRVLLVVLLIGLLTHVVWRLVLAVRGEPGDDEDGKSAAKRAANVGRAAVYVAFSAAAVRILFSHPSKKKETEDETTSSVLGWPGGQVIVVVAGVVVLGVGAWNVKKAVTKSFLEDLDLGSLDQSKRRVVELLGTAGYLARAVAFGLIGWFLVTAGFQHDPEETRGLDESLRELAAGDYGPLLLAVLALGLVLFGAYRVLDGVFRKRSELSHS